MEILSRFPSGKARILVTWWRENILSSVPYFGQRSIYLKAHGHRFSEGIPSYRTDVFMHVGTQTTLPTRLPSLSVRRTDASCNKLRRSIMCGPPPAPGLASAFRSSSAELFYGTFRPTDARVLSDAAAIHIHKICAPELTKDDSQR